ncbi:hypothetical protein [Polaribacter sp. SA4-12]|uniref:hypothetical protein n=1 Tax=Polaribacter sp. SA4-12 TaxID=1312072 RepID=UPI000B3C39CD|nr:hypothetical protein [Polaribacter sp. SA4-12]ARV16632.1 hypothetical protein BTO07_16470 [Polaribacter sp. SA4-12]
MNFKLSLILSSILIYSISSYSQGSTSKPHTTNKNILSFKEITKKINELRKRQDFLMQKEISPGIQNHLKELTPILDIVKINPDKAKIALNKLKIFKTKWSVSRPKFVEMDNEYLKLDREIQELNNVKNITTRWHTSFEEIDTNIKSYEKTINWQIKQNKSK